MHIKSEAVIWTVKAYRPKSNRKSNIYEFKLKGFDWKK